MTAGGLLFVGITIGLGLATGSALLWADEPTRILRNGILKGWPVTRDNEALLCRDPVIFVRAKQIECE
jgi:hypothetical protein